jgi:hypothetical protein
MPPKDQARRERNNHDWNVVTLAGVIGPAVKDNRSY